MVSVTGTFKRSGDVLGFKPDRNAPSSVPNTVLVTAFTQFPGVPPHLVVPTNGVVTVEYNIDRRELQLPVARWLDRDLLESYPEGTVTLGLVQAVGRQQATVFVHPSLPIVMRREDVSSAAQDVLDHLLSDGDVIPVRITRGPNGNVKLRAHDINDDEPVLLAPELFPGRGPWLEAIAVSTVDEIRERYLEQKRKFDETEAAMVKLAEQFDTDIEQLREMFAGIGTSTGEIPLAPTERTDKQKIADAMGEMATAHVVRIITNYKREIDELRKANRQLAEAYESASASEREASNNLSEERQKNQELTKRLKVERNVEVVADRRSNFTTAEEWIREEMRRYWLDTYTPSDRARYVLDNGSFGVLPSFAETFATLDDGEMVKAIRTAVHVVTGRNADENIAEVHDLREGDGASAPTVTRGDGAICRRVYIESHTAQARRMHFWRLTGGRIELSRVGLHDDFTP